MMSEVVQFGLVFCGSFGLVSSVIVSCVHGRDASIHSRSPFHEHPEVFQREHHVPMRNGLDNARFQNCQREARASKSIYRCAQHRIASVGVPIELLKPCSWWSRSQLFWAWRILLLSWAILLISAWWEHGGYTRTDRHRLTDALAHQCCHPPSPAVNNALTHHHVCSPSTLLITAAM